MDAPHAGLIELPDGFALRVEFGRAREPTTSVLPLGRRW